MGDGDPEKAIGTERLDDRSVDVSHAVGRADRQPGFPRPSTRSAKEAA